MTVKARLLARIVHGVDVPYRIVYRGVVDYRPHVSTRLPYFRRLWDRHQGALRVTPTSKSVNNVVKSKQVRDREQQKKSER
jgi:hypothetical protein